MQQVKAKARNWIIRQDSVRFNKYNITSISNQIQTMRKSPNKLSSTLKQPQNQNSDLILSNLNTVQNNKSNLMTQTIAPKKGHQIDNYEGPVDPITRMRHGLGLYRYPNKFFTYEGNYEQGVKQGKGTLKFADRTIINGTFQKDELIGEAEIFYPDGSTYKGQLKLGQKSGFGIFKSKLESYEGEYKQNKRHGQGTLITPTIKIIGSFQNNKPHGPSITITKYNYEYKGACKEGKKSGRGLQISKYLDDKFQYDGQFAEDKFDGHGLYRKDGTQDTYRYEGNFVKGKPALYPNQFKILIASSMGAQSQKPSPESFNCITTDQNLATPIQYELEGENLLYFVIESCYQGPEQLDPNQPTQQQIEKMIKDWQNENKKNKNPPPMPDFRQPRKIKPALALVNQQSQRLVQIKIAKIDGTEIGPLMKIDYRSQMKKKRAQNEVAKAEAAKKAEQEGNKKGGKGPAKGEIQLKVNVFSENPSQKQKSLKIMNKDGKAEVERLQFPDDFPAGSYYLIFSSPFNLFGQVKQVKKTITVKPKNAGGKKK